MEICPYLEETFKILGRSWNGLLINYLSRCDVHAAQFSDIKKDLKITPRALSLKLSELIDWGLIEKKALNDSPQVIKYILTTKGVELAEAMSPIEEWARRNLELEEPSEQRA